MPCVLPRSDLRSKVGQKREKVKPLKKYTEHTVHGAKASAKFFAGKIPEAGHGNQAVISLHLKTMTSVRLCLANRKMRPTDHVTSSLFIFMFPAKPSSYRIDMCSDNLGACFIYTRFE